MGESARVHSIDAISDFREVLCRFGEDTRNVLGSVEMEIRRTLDWLQHDRPTYWKGEVRRWDRAFVEARSALHRKNLQRTSGFIPDVSEEKEAMRRAKARMEDAQERIEKARKWVPLLQHAISEYEGQARPLGDLVTIDLERSLELLDRMVIALEGYVATAPPRLSDPAGGGQAPAQTSPAEAEAAEDAENEAPPPAAGNVQPVGGVEG